MSKGPGVLATLLLIVSMLLSLACAGWSLHLGWLYLGLLSGYRNVHDPEIMAAIRERPEDFVEAVQKGREMIHHMSQSLEYSSKSLLVLNALLFVVLLLVVAKGSLRRYSGVLLGPAGASAALLVGMMAFAKKWLQTATEANAQPIPRAGDPVFVELESLFSTLRFNSILAAAFFSGLAILFGFVCYRSGLVALRSRLDSGG